MEFDLKVRVKHQGRPRTLEGPRLPSMKNVMALLAMVIILAVAYYLLGIDPERLIGPG